MTSRSSLLRSRPRRPAATPRPRSERPVTKALDVFDGYVREIVDGRTIDLNLLQPTAEQLERYGACEVVRLVGLAVESAPAASAESDLRIRLHRRHVRCFVHGRDESGRLLAVAVPVAQAS
jgi:endonuclease YncB( thermonuclease family)